MISPLMISEPHTSPHPTSSCDAPPIDSTPASTEALDAAVSPRGFRLLAKVPRLPGAVVDRLVDHFGSLQRLLGATVEDLQAVDGVGDARARSVREGLSRLAEASILERYV